MWKSCVQAPSYEVSDDGQVRNASGRLLKLQPSNGYLRVELGRKKYRVHHLVLTAFVGPCPPGQEAAHLNGDRQDNRVTNLAWKTRQGQHEDRRRHGTDMRGERSSSAILTEADVREIRERKLSQSKLAERFGVSIRTIQAIHARRIWKHI